MELTKAQRIILLRAYVRKVCYPGEINFIRQPAPPEGWLAKLRAERAADPERFFRTVDPSLLEPREVQLNTAQLQLVRRALKKGRVDDVSKWRWVPQSCRGMTKADLLGRLEDCEND